MNFKSYVNEDERRKCDEGVRIFKSVTPSQTDKSSLLNFIRNAQHVLRDLYQVEFIEMNV